MVTFFKFVAWVAGGLVALAAIAFVGFWLFLDYTAQRMCRNQVIQTTELREANLAAITFQRDCGATTGFSTQVSMIGIGEELPNEPGNIFSADTDHGNAPAAELGGPEVRVESLSEWKIKILHHPKARVFISQKQWEGVSIEYGNL